MIGQPQLRKYKKNSERSTKYLSKQSILKEIEKLQSSLEKVLGVLKGKNYIVIDRDCKCLDSQLQDNDAYVCLGWDGASVHIKYGICGSGGVENVLIGCVVAQVCLQHGLQVYWDSKLHHMIVSLTK
jgi:hypothetical protein